METTNSHFGGRLQCALDALGITQARLAEMVSVSPPTVHRWLGGQAPQPATQRYLAATLGVSHEWLFRGVIGAAEHPLHRARQRAGMHIRDLSKATGYAIGVLQAVENGARASEKMIEAIGKVLPSFDAAGALNAGDHPAIVRDDGTEAPYGTKPRLELSPGMKARYVPLLSFAQAGRYELDGTDEGWTGEGFIAFDVADSKAFALRIEGDSMSPNISAGDVVIVAPTWCLRRGEAVVIKTTDGEILCKVWGGEKDGAVVLLSHNASHPEIRIPRDQVAWIYPVAQVTKQTRRP